MMLLFFQFISLVKLKEMVSIEQMNFNGILGFSKYKQFRLNLICHLTNITKSLDYRVNIF